MYSNTMFTLYAKNRAKIHFFSIIEEKNIFFDLTRLQQNHFVGYNPIAFSTKGAGVRRWRTPAPFHV